DTEQAGKRPGHRVEVRGAHREAVIGGCAGETGGALDRIETVHRPAVCAVAPAGREGTDVAERPLCGREEIGGERDDAGRVCEAVAGLDVFAQRDAGALASGSARDGLPPAPSGEGESIEERTDLSVERG